MSHHDDAYNEDGAQDCGCGHSHAHDELNAAHADEREDTSSPAGLSRRDMLKLSSQALAGAALFGTLKGHKSIPGSRLLSRLSAEQQAQTTPKRIYIASDDHTDYYWTADANTYRDSFIRMIDYYLDLADTTQNNPADFQSRWNCDGSFWVWTYEHNKPPAEFERLINRIRSGHISMPLTPLVILWGGAPAEAVLRGMYYAGTVERRFNLRFPLAVSMENQTLPYGLGALWAGAGARYSWKGVCGCATRITGAAKLRDREMYWWVGPDGSRILMKWNSQLVANNHIGGYAEANDPFAIVDYVDTNTTFIGRYPYRVIGAFGKGWDRLETLSDEFVTAARNRTNANRRVIVSNEADFFTDFETTYGTQIQNQSLAFGNEWDIYCASMAEVSAQIKRLVEKLRAAEALATLVTLKDSTFMAGRESERNLAFMSIGLYWEHNWTADGPIARDVRADWQRELVANIAAYIDPLFNDAAAALGGMIPTSGTNTRFYAFNPLSWTRTDIADLPYTSTDPVHVIDVATGEETPSQIVTVDGQRRLRILARDIPSVGYKVFEIVPGAGGIFSDAATVSGRTMENATYRLTLATRGAITSLIDKTRSNREFARTINGFAINDLGTGSGSVTVENAGPVSVTLRATSSGPRNHTSRVTLIRDVNRIDIRNDITQNFSDVLSWKFGFDLNSPDVWHEEVGAIIRAKLTPNGQYATTNARYDWLTLNHFADMSANGGIGITLSNADCYFMQLGASTPTSLDTSSPQISVLAGGQVDGPTLGILNQDGDSAFMQRFALRTRDNFAPAEAMRFALEHQNPLITGTITGGQSRYPETSFSLLNINDSNVLLWALKPADDDNAHIIARFWNVSSAMRDMTLTFPGQMIQEASATTHIETPLGPANLSNGVLRESFTAQQLRTFSLALAALTSGNDLPECDTTTATVNEQEFLAALQTQPAGPIQPVLVIFTTIGMDIYAEAEGVTGVTSVYLQQGNGFVQIGFTAVTTTTGDPAPPPYVQTINLNLPDMIVSALDQLVNERFGPNPDVETITVRGNVLDICA